MLLSVSKWEISSAYKIVISSRNTKLVSPKFTPSRNIYYAIFKNFTFKLQVSVGFIWIIQIFPIYSMNIFFYKLNLNKFVVAFTILAIQIQIKTY